MTVDTLSAALRGRLAPISPFEVLSRHHAILSKGRESALATGHIVARNIEIKARIDSVQALAQRVAKLADSGPTEILQDDTFFACAGGRLKLRIFSDTEGQLIFYCRQDNLGPKESIYYISPTTSPHALLNVLSRAYGQIGRVKKRRTLFLIGRTRVHIDHVDQLGDFVELEVVLGDNEAAAAGMAIAEDLLVQLGISRGQLVERAYIDLLSI
jgi:predicted adenylyl cyclase CyaB